VENQILVQLGFDIEKLKKVKSMKINNKSNFKLRKKTFQMGKDSIAVPLIKPLLRQPVSSSYLTYSLILAIISQLDFVVI